MKSKEGPAKTASVVAGELSRLEAARRARLGELVCATGADSLGFEALAGALIALADAPLAEKEGWLRRGEAYFCGRRGRKPAKSQSPGSQNQANPGPDAPP